MSKGSGRRRRPAGADLVDTHVAGRLRELRVLRGMTQEELAGLIGLTFQQVQKYERGANRMSAGRLAAVSNALNVPVSFFFDGAPGMIGPEAQEDVPSFLGGRHPRESLEFMRYYLNVEPAKRRHLYALVKCLGQPAA